VKKYQESQAQLSKQSHDLELAHKETRRVSLELDSLRERLKTTLEEKIALENTLNQIERLEEGRIAELETKFAELNEEYRKVLDERRTLKMTEKDLRKELLELQKGRDSFKEQFLELREVNKEMKAKFVNLEKQVGEMVAKERKEEQDKENAHSKKAAMLDGIQGMIREYRKNAMERKI